jgi:hypothetical protein
MMITGDSKRALCLVYSSVLMKTLELLGMDKASILASMKVPKMVSKAVAPTILLERLETQRASDSRAI